MRIRNRSAWFIPSRLTGTPRRILFAGLDWFLMCHCVLRLGREQCDFPTATAARGVRQLLPRLDLVAVAVAVEAVVADRLRRNPRMELLPAVASVDAPPTVPAKDPLSGIRT